jgi:hypothetical protein
MIGKQIVVVVFQRWNLTEYGDETTVGVRSVSRVWIKRIS